MERENVQYSTVVIEKQLFCLLLWFVAVNVFSYCTYCHLIQRHSGIKVPTHRHTDIVVIPLPLPLHTVSPLILTPLPGISLPANLQHPNQYKWLHYGANTTSGLTLNFKGCTSLPPLVQ